MSSDASQRGGAKPDVERPAWLIQQLEREAPKPNFEPKRVAGYVRCATDSETSHSGERQKVNVETYCSIVFPNAKITFFEDLDRSDATLVGREKLAEMMAKIRAKDFDVLVVEEFDRLSRDAKDGIQFFADVEEHGVELHSVFQQKRLNGFDVAGRYAADSQELFKFRRRALQARERMAAAGRRPTGTAYGLKQVIVNGRKDVALDDEESRVVRRLCNSVINGISPRVIADSLNSENVPSPGGGPWKGTSVGRIVRDGRNTGWLHYNLTTTTKDENGTKKLVRNTSDKWKVSYRHDLRIVSDEEFERALKILTDPAPRYPVLG